MRQECASKANAVHLGCRSRKVTRRKEQSEAAEAQFVSLASQVKASLAQVKASQAHVNASLAGGQQDMLDKVMINISESCSPLCGLVSSTPWSPFSSCLPDHCHAPSDACVGSFCWKNWTANENVSDDLSFPRLHHSVYTVAT